MDELCAGLHARNPAFVLRHHSQGRRHPFEMAARVVDEIAPGRLVMPAPALRITVAQRLTLFGALADLELDDARAAAVLRLVDDGSGHPIQ